MIRTQEIILDCVLPDDGIGLVIMQPFVELNAAEPYKWLTEKKDKQIERIIRSMEIAKRADHGCEKTHFTIFPEYSIPGLEGIQSIQDILQTNDWDKGTFVIGGIDGLTKDEYSTLCNQDNTFVHDLNKIESVPDDRWINCCIIWVKDSNGIIKRWIQPKIVPASVEELCASNHMFEGRAVYLFRPSISVQNSKIPFRFLCFICKDWIGNIGGSKLVDIVLNQLDRQRNDNSDRLDIYLCIVLKRNPKPDYPLFLQNTVQYVNESNYISIRRADGAVLFVNNSGRDKAGYCSDFGRSGFVFHPNCSFVTHKEYCPPTYTLKKREGLVTCKEARFREDGSCIISFKFMPPIPFLVRRAPNAPLIPINPAIVHPIDAIIDESNEDSRTPGKEVPASVKWINDCLDGIDFLFFNENSHPFRNEIENSHSKICQQIRKADDSFLCKYITISSPEMEENDNKWIKSSSGRRIHNVDNWSQNEEKNLKTILYALSMVGVYKQLDVSGSPAHATIKTQDKIIDLIIVSGKTHDECYEYAKDKYQGSGQRYGVIITQDLHNSSWMKKYESILKTRNDNVVNDPNITDLGSNHIRCGYQNLVTDCFNSNNLNEFCNHLTNTIGI